MKKKTIGYILNRARYDFVYIKLNKPGNQVTTMTLEMAKEMNIHASQLFPALDYVSLAESMQRAGYIIPDDIDFMDQTPPVEILFEDLLDQIKDNKKNQEKNNPPYDAPIPDIEGYQYFEGQAPLGQIIEEQKKKIINKDRLRGKMRVAREQLKKIADNQQFDEMAQLDAIEE